MVYKALNTFIDDLFAFIIKMPTLHRLACLRDDLIFLIYLYQRWVYRVDFSRVNEYGQGGDVDPDPAAIASSATPDDVSEHPAAVTSANAVWPRPAATFARQMAARSTVGIVIVWRSNALPIFAAWATRTYDNVNSLLLFFLFLFRTAPRPLC